MYEEMIPPKLKPLHKNLGLEAKIGFYPLSLGKSVV